MKKLEDIKVGETYNVRVTVALIGDSIIHCSIGGTTINFWKTAVSAFSPISHENGIKNTKTTPKYDPCRKFREGDRVHMKPEVNGRSVYIAEDAWEPLDPNEIWTVEEDELETGWVRIKTDCVHAIVWHAMLELVTPVEELDPYTVDECGFAPTFYVRKNGKVYMTIPYKEGTSLFQSREEALAAAEAERDRLNAEHRKEQNND